VTYSYFVDRTFSTHAQARFSSDQLLETREEVLAEVERLDSEGQIDWKDRGIFYEYPEEDVVQRDGEGL